MYSLTVESGTLSASNRAKKWMTKWPFLSLSFSTKSSWIRKRFAMLSLPPKVTFNSLSIIMKRKCSLYYCEAETMNVYLSASSMTVFCKTRHAKLESKACRTSPRLWFTRTTRCRTCCTETNPSILWSKHWCQSRHHSFHWEALQALENPHFLEMLSSTYWNANTSLVASSWSIWSICSNYANSFRSSRELLSKALH